MTSDLKLPNACVFDLETTIYEYNKRKASPFYPDNYVVAAGYKYNEEPVQCHYFADKQGFSDTRMPLDNVDVLVGFNIKFDLLYCWNREELQQFFRRGGRIFDCQYVHYLLHGMQAQSHMPSMDSVVEGYGGTLKMDVIKDFWDRGINTPDIPEDLLIEYLEGDVTNTHTIFKKQYQMCQAIHPNFLQMVWNRMDGLLCTTEMEHNGLKIDLEQGELDREELLISIADTKQQLESFLPEMPPELEFNWNSSIHKSCFLFGGTVKYKKWKHKTDEYGVLQYAQKKTVEVLVDEEGEPLRYKSGKRKGEIKTRYITELDFDKPKGRLEDHYFRFNQLTEPREKWKVDTTDAIDDPLYSTGADIIKELGNRNIPALKAMALYQKEVKDLGTYYWTVNDKGNKTKGMLTLLDNDDFIHHKLNHCSTVTSRLSSSDPQWGSINFVNSGELLLGQS